MNELGTRPDGRETFFRLLDQQRDEQRGTRAGAAMRRLAERCHLAEVVPPRDLESGALAARGMLRAPAGERASLEIAVDADGSRWFVRAGARPALDHALAQLRAAYPQARAEPVPPERSELDPALPLGEERTVVVELLHASEPALALRSEWRYDPDPLAGLVAGIEPEPGERVVCRLSLGPAPRGAAARIRRRAAPAVRTWREPPAPRGPSPLLRADVRVPCGGAGDGVTYGAAWGEATMTASSGESNLQNSTKPAGMRGSRHSGCWRASARSVVGSSIVMAPSGHADISVPPGVPTCPRPRVHEVRTVTHAGRGDAGGLGYRVRGDERWSPVETHAVGRADRPATSILYVGQPRDAEFPAR